MKIKWLLGLVLAALIFNLAFQGSSFAGASKGDMAPDFSLTRADGSTCSLSDFKGKNYVYIMFWAVNAMYCPYELQGLRNRYEELQKNGFEVIAVNVKDDEAKAREFVAQEKLPFPVVLDKDGAIAKAYSVKTLPVMLIIDKEGQIKWRGYEFPATRYMKIVEK